LGKPVLPKAGTEEKNEAPTSGATLMRRICGRYGTPGPGPRLKRGNIKTYSQKIAIFIKDEEAAASTEYALLVLLVALAIIGVGTTIIGPKVAAIFTKTDTEFPTGS
jgi:Flp pilus assembly pilin Flp